MRKSMGGAPGMRRALFTHTSLSVARFLLLPTFPHAIVVLRSRVRVCVCGCVRHRLSPPLTWLHFPLYLPLPLLLALSSQWISSTCF